MSGTRPDDRDDSHAQASRLQVAVQWSCQRCGFDLHGRSCGERCPECGTTIAPSRFRGLWNDPWARRRFVVGASMFIGAAAVETLRAALQFVARLFGSDGMWVAWLNFVAPLCLLSAVVLATAARRVAVVWLLATALAARAVCEAAMLYARFVGWLMEIEVYRWFLIVWAAASVSAAMLPVVIARSSGRPQGRLAMWCCCLVGALGNAYCGLTVVDTDITQPIRDLIQWIAPGGIGGSSMTLGFALGAAGTMLGYLLLVRGIRRAE